LSLVIKVIIVDKAIHTFHNVTYCWN